VGLQDRDYMHNRQTAMPFKRTTNWRMWLVAATLAISMLSAIVYMIRDAKNLADDFRPTSGSLVVNINTATASQLETIPGIGSTRAAQIIAGRPYESVDDLVKVVGIGDKSINGLRPFVTTEGETRKR